MNNYRVLNNPPIIAALCQMKFEAIPGFMQDTVKIEQVVRKSLPLRTENIQVGIDLENTSIPIGVSRISAKSDAKIDTYIYTSEDKNMKLEVQEDTLTFVDENPYLGWESFRDKALALFSIFSGLLQNKQIMRLSIRFVNRFELPNFDNPQEYFRTQISSSDDQYPLPYPLMQYNFRLVMQIPESKIISAVNQGVQQLPSNLYEYIYDIDVLDNTVLIFDVDQISTILNNLRNIKNEIFFGNATDKTLDLCN